MIEQIRLITDTKEINLLYDYLKKFPLDYLDYSLWLKKCKRELELGYKKAFCVFDSKGIIGSVVFQPHKQEKSVLELKNLRVNPDFKEKGVGSILETLVSFFAEENNFKGIQGDAHPGNPVISFMIKRGYKIKAAENLYTLEKEIILWKDV